jgi:Flp pilus assembly protein TadG
MTQTGRLGIKIRQFLRNRKAAAAVEFALILPVLLTLYLGSIEGSQLITVDRKVTLVSGALGDLVARSQNTITSGKIDDYFQMTTSMMSPVSTTGLKQIVSSVYIKAGVAKVVWSRAYGTGATKRAVNSTYPFPANDKIKTLVTDGYVIVSEVSFAYRPMLGLFFHNDIGLYHEGVYLPRFGSAIACSGC